MKKPQTELGIRVQTGIVLTVGVLNLITILTAVKIIRHQLPDVIDADRCEADR